MVSNGYEIRVSSYSISYKDSSTGNICSPITTIPTTSCADNRVCQHTFEVSSSFCHPLTNITVTVMTTSMLGSEEESNPLMIGNHFSHSNTTLHLGAHDVKSICSSYILYQPCMTISGYMHVLHYLVCHDHVCSRKEACRLPGIA